MNQVQTIPRKLSVTLPGGTSYEISLTQSSDELHALPPAHKNVHEVLSFLCQNRHLIPNHWAPLGYVLFFPMPGEVEVYRAVGLVFYHDHWSSVKFKKDTMLPKHEYTWIGTLSQSRIS